MPREFVARNSIEVRVDEIARVGELLDAAVQGGATSIGGVRFDIQERDKVEREALRLAVVDARSRAEAAVAGAGRTIDRIIKIEDSRESGIVPPPRPMMMMKIGRRGGDDAGRAWPGRDPRARDPHGVDAMTRAPSLTPEGYDKARRLLMRRDPVLGAAIKQIGACGMADRQRKDHLSALVRLDRQPAAVDESRGDDLRPVRRAVSRRPHPGRGGDCGARAMRRCAASG